nr:DUF2975 domain-containing protein [uncultured Romboutsia sp.]
MKKDYSARILNNIVLVGIILTLLLLLAMPLILTAMFKSGLGVVGSNLPMNISIVIYICAIPYVISLFILKKLCKIIVIKQPFLREIPKYLRQISICAFSEILIYNIVQVALYYIFDIYLYGLTIMSAIIVSFVSLAIGFLSLVLSKLFDMAIEIKEENDKTI